MNRNTRQILQLVALLLVLIMSACGEQLKETKKPNILFLFADDQRADALGCAGNPYINTPNIDQLSKSGLRFSSAYVMGGHHGAICAASRAMLMSGLSLYHVYDVLDGVYTMPKHFADNGYTTFGTGKWHNGASSFEATFQKGENVFIGGMCDHFKVPCRTLGADGKLSEPTTKGYSTDLFADAAIDFIDGYAQDANENPFFCYVAFTAPHDPRSPREDYIGTYNDDAMPVPGNFKPYHPFAFEDMQIRDENLGAWPRTPEMIQKSLADYYAMMTHLDKRVGDIINTLKEKGLYENTIIVYAADNGLAIGSHGLLGKQNLYEHSTNVPLIISGPGVPEGQLSDAMVYLYDLFPTLTELSTIPAPQGVDGTSLMSIVKQPTADVRSSLFTTYRNTVRAVRTDKWKMIRYPDRDVTQLFDLSQDPLEINDLSDQEDLDSIKQEMNALLVNWQTTADDTAKLTASTILPTAYDPTSFTQKPDIFQPKYVLERYFEGVDVSNKETPGWNGGDH